LVTIFFTDVKSFAFRQKRTTNRMLHINTCKFKMLQLIASYGHFSFVYLEITQLGFFRSYFVIVWRYKYDSIKK